MPLGRVISLSLLACLAGCGPELVDELAPADRSAWALDAIGESPLPAAPGPAFQSIVLADTLVFGVQDDRWAPRPLARSDRVIRLDDQVLVEPWFYTYDDPPTGRFAIRGLCADGDLASCIDASATAFLDGDALRIEFTLGEVFGTLRYHRVR